MKPESSQLIHVGISYVTAPLITIDKHTYLGFQQAIHSCGIEFDQAAHQENRIIVTRQSPTPLQLTVNVLPPQLGQLLVVAPQPQRTLNSFVQEAEAVIEAFTETWPAQNRQIVGCDVTIRKLYEATKPHAFEELWEDLLGQSAQSLTAFGRPVLGGGLRFVMPPVAQDGDEPRQIEVKIESYLRATNKLFVEVQFAWPQPAPPGKPFGVKERLLAVSAYIESEVLDFATGGSQNGHR